MSMSTDIIDNIIEASNRALPYIPGRDAMWRKVQERDGGIPLRCLLKEEVTIYAKVWAYIDQRKNHPECKSMVPWLDEKLAPIRDKHDKLVSAISKLDTLRHQINPADCMESVHFEQPVEIQDTASVMAVLSGVPTTGSAHLTSASTGGFGAFAAQRKSASTGGFGAFAASVQQPTAAAPGGFAAGGFGSFTTPAPSAPPPAPTAFGSTAFGIAHQQPASSGVGGFGFGGFAGAAPPFPTFSSTGLGTAPPTTSTFSTSAATPTFPSSARNNSQRPQPVNKKSKKKKF